MPTSIRSEIDFQTMQDARTFFFHTFAVYRSTTEVQKAEQHDVDEIAQYDAMLHVIQLHLDIADDKHDLFALQTLKILRSKVFENLEFNNSATGEDDCEFPKHCSLITFLDTIKENFEKVIDKFRAEC